MTWWTPDGTREVSQIQIDGRAAFRVRNPQHGRTQEPSESGIVRPRYVQLEQHGQKVTVLAPATIGELAALGVDITVLVSDQPANAKPTDPPAPDIKRKPGEKPAQWNERKYYEGIGALLGGIANARRERAA